MARGVNKVILIGNIGNEPEMRYFPNGGAVCNMTLATSEQWKDKNTGEQKEATEWHKLVFTNKLAEIAAEYVKKGSKLYVEGSLKTRKWQNQQGQDQYTTEIKVSEMQMLDSRGNSQATNQQQGGYTQQQPAQQGGYNSQPNAGKQQSVCHVCGGQDPECPNCGMPF